MHEGACTRGDDCSTLTRIVARYANDLEVDLHFKIKNASAVSGTGKVGAKIRLILRESQHGHDWSINSTDHCSAGHSIRLCALKCVHASWFQSNHFLFILTRFWDDCMAESLSHVTVTKLAYPARAPHSVA